VIDPPDLSILHEFTQYPRHCGDLMFEICQDDANQLIKMAVAVQTFVNSIRSDITPGGIQSGKV
jgi:hypothetical protein